MRRGRVCTAETTLRRAQRCRCAWVRDIDLRRQATSVRPGLVRGLRDVRCRAGTSPVSRQRHRGGQRVAGGPCGAEARSGCPGSGRPFRARDRAGWSHPRCRRSRAWAGSGLRWSCRNPCPQWPTPRRSSLRPASPPAACRQTAASGPSRNGRGNQRASVASETAAVPRRGPRRSGAPRPRACRSSPPCSTSTSARIRSSRLTARPCAISPPIDKPDEHGIAHRQRVERTFCVADQRAHRIGGVGHVRLAMAAHVQPDQAQPWRKQRAARYPTACRSVPSAWAKTTGGPAGRLHRGTCSRRSFRNRCGIALSSRKRSSARRNMSGSTLPPEATAITAGPGRSPRPEQCRGKRDGAARLQHDAQPREGQRHGAQRLVVASPQGPGRRGAAGSGR